MLINVKNTLYVTNRSRRKFLGVTNVKNPTKDYSQHTILKGERLESVFEKPTIHLGFDILQATMWMEGVNRWKID